MRGTNVKLLISVIGLILITGSIPAMAEDAPGASFDMAVMSKYMWRGFELSDESIVLQPSLVVSYRGYWVNLWSNLDMDNGEDRYRNTLNENDFCFGYDKSCGSVSVGASYLYYGYGAGTIDWQEFSVYGSLDMILAPTLTINREFAYYPSTYVNLGVSHSIPLTPEITLDLAGSVGYYSFSDNGRNKGDGFVKYDDDLVATDDLFSSLNDLQVSAGVPIPFGGICSVTPTVIFSTAMGSDAENFYKVMNKKGDEDEGDTSFIYGGITFSMSF